MINFMKHSDTDAEAWLQDRLIAETWKWAEEYHWWVIDPSGNKHEGTGNVVKMMHQKIQELYPGHEILVIFSELD